jgi:hypothetical protein
MKIVLAIALASISLAQNPNTAAYPGRVATDTDLLVATNNVTTTLTIPLGVGDTTITVASTTGIQVPTALSIDSEIIKVCSKGSTTFTVCSSGRGFDGTTPTTHNVNAAVNFFVVSDFHNQAAAEIKAIETTLGTNFVAPPQLLSTSTYDFASQAPGGSLTAGIGASVTLTPCPLGVNGGDTNHYLYISGGSGTAEAVLLAGGSCTSGAATGSVIFTPANSHSGAWTIKSASSGIKECFVLAGNGGSCYTPSGTSNFYAPLYLDWNQFSWRGSGNSSIIQQQFVGDGIIVGPPALTSTYLTVSDLNAVWGFGVGTYGSSGAIWVFKNIGQGFFNNLKAFLAYEGFRFNGVQQATWSNMQSISGQIAYHWVSNPSSINLGGVWNNLEGETQAGGTCLLVEPIIAGVSITNINVGGLAAYGIRIVPSAVGGSFLNELVVDGGFIDSSTVSALAVTYVAGGVETVANTMHFSNMRMHSIGSAPTVDISLLGGYMFSNVSVVNAGTGKAISLAGVRNSQFTNCLIDVSSVAAVPVAFVAGTGGEVNSNINFSGNQVGFNDMTPTTALNSDTSAGTGIKFSANRFNGAIGWNQTGANNVWDLSNQVIPSIPFSLLPGFANGSSLFCRDCNSTCTAGSATGRTCFRENGGWTH